MELWSLGNECWTLPFCDSSLGWPGTLCVPLSSLSCEECLGLLLTLMSGEMETAYLLPESCLRLRPSICVRTVPGVNSLQHRKLMGFAVLGMNYGTDCSHSNRNSASSLMNQRGREWGLSKIREKGSPSSHCLKWCLNANLSMDFQMQPRLYEHHINRDK